MTEQKNRVQIFAVAIAMLLIGAAVQAQTSCTSTTNINGNTTLLADYATTSASNDCLDVTANNVTLNCNGHSLICNNAGGCGAAVHTSMSNVTVRECHIISGTGDWSSGVTSSSGNDTSVLQNLIENALYGILLGDDIQRNVLNGIRGTCITSGFGLFNAGTLIADNYCRSTDDGFLVSGPVSGTAQVVENYVRASDVGLIQPVGLVEFEKNIVDSATFSYFAVPGDVTLIDNICDDPDCPDPASPPFGLSITFH